MLSLIPYTLHTIPSVSYTAMPAVKRERAATPEHITAAAAPDKADDSPLPASSGLDIDIKPTTPSPNKKPKTSAQKAAVNYKGGSARPNKQVSHNHKLAWIVSLTRAPLRQSRSQSR